MKSEFGNAGSRTHTYGTRAMQAVEVARRQISSAIATEPSDVVFTGGATEANNLALLGIEAHGRATARTHIISTAIEHKAVLEPLAALQARGFEVELVSADSKGAVSTEDVLERVRNDTLLVSVMQVNNETGSIQPLSDIAAGLPEDIYLHTDAAQGFTKVDSIRDPRIDLVSLSGHKIFGPKGVGALIVRRRARRRPPLAPLMHGGGQERGLRPGTLAVPLIAGIGLAAELAVSEASERRASCLRMREEVLKVLAPLDPQVNGSGLGVPHILNFSILGLDAEAAMVRVKAQVAISNGSACTSALYTHSHVLEAMGLSSDRCRSALRVSWSHNSSITNLRQAVRQLSTAILE